MHKQEAQRVAETELWEFMKLNYQMLILWYDEEVAREQLSLQMHTEPWILGICWYMGTYNFMRKPLKIVENRPGGCDDEKTMKSLLGIISKSRGGDIVITVSNQKEGDLISIPW